jgi:hypothetical protein
MVFVVLMEENPVGVVNNHKIECLFKLVKNRINTLKFVFVIIFK